MPVNMMASALTKPRSLIESKGYCRLSIYEFWQREELSLEFFVMASSSSSDVGTILGCYHRLRAVLDFLLVSWFINFNLISQLGMFILVCDIRDKQLIFMILQALQLKYSQLKVSYNTQNNHWTMDELIAQCVKEKNRQTKKWWCELGASCSGKKETNGASSKGSKSSKNPSKSAKTTESSKTSNNLVKIKTKPNSNIYGAKPKVTLRMKCLKSGLRVKAKQVSMCVWSVIWLKFLQSHGVLVLAILFT